MANAKRRQLRIILDAEVSGVRLRTLFDPPATSAPVPKRRHEVLG